MLPVQLSPEDTKSIAEAGSAQVDLSAQEVRWEVGGELRTASFDIDPETKHRLLNGLDDIALTLQQAGAIDAYESERERSGPVTTALQA
jgi:3-isopropylmalate/(R)-2-methylmalate dehydratase small subunit